MNDKLAACLAGVKETTPLVHIITNYVTINDCANILLAVGGSPAMCEAADEAFEFSQIANALYLNIGTLTKEQELAMYLAIRGAQIKGVPVVLDPVACGAIPHKVDVIRKLQQFGSFSVIKGNQGEIKALAGMEARVRGVDSIDGGDNVVEACQKAARDFGCVVVATGQTDVVSDGIRTCQVENGTELLTRITGAGCMVGALIGGFCGANRDMYLASAAALATFSLAGELAHEVRGGKQPGTFRISLFDQISQVDQNILKDRSRVKWM